MVDFRAAAIARAVRAGKLSAQDAVADCLDRIADRGVELDAFQTQRPEKAFNESRLIDARDDLSTLPLAGVPLAVKDNVPVTGEPMRVGSAATSALPQTHDHPVVARLRAAGAVVVGITAVPELCLWGTTDSQLGIARNPWDRSRTPGGSSGGSATAVAGGLVPVAHGTDGLGSLRIPAANCGLFGIKPGRGLVPADIGVNSSFGMAENGPIATTIEDAALLLSVMAGRPELAQVLPAATLRVAVAAGAPMPTVRLDSHWRDALRRVADVLDAAGHRVDDAALPYPATPTALLTRWFGVAALEAEFLDRKALQPRTRRHAWAGGIVNRLGLVRQGDVDRIEADLRGFFDRFDVVLTPMLSQSPPQALRWSERSWSSNVITNIRYAPYAALWNLVGWPAASVPAGVHPITGTPLAVQIAAPPGGEATILGLAADIERRLPWERVAPGYQM